MRISVVPGNATLVFPHYNAAVAKAHELAREGHVDLWLTERSPHFMKLGSYPRISPAAE